MKESFIKSVKVVARTDVPSNENVVSSHVRYKVKQNDDGTLKLKARIAPHGNEKNVKEVLTKDCTTCPSIVLRIVESIALLFGWTIYKADVNSAFRQTEAADRDVYMKLPRKSRLRSIHQWLLLTAAYGLVKPMGNGL